jgi:rubredoxin
MRKWECSSCGEVNDSSKCNQCGKQYDADEDRQV